MTAVNETLQQLLERRLTELGDHRGEPLSLLEAYQAIPPEEHDHVTYEVVRRVRKAGHTRLSDRAVRTLATMLRVDENVVRQAAGQRPAAEPFELPARAAKLNDQERAVVLSVIDAILGAGERVDLHTGSGKTHGMLAAVTDPPPPSEEEQLAQAARRGGTPEGQRIREKLDQDAEG